MSALLASELRRFFSRRLVHAAFAFGIALSTLVLVIVTVRSDFRTVHQSGSSIVCTSPAPSGPATISPQGTLPPGCTFQSPGDVRQDHRLKIGTSYGPAIKGTGVAMVFIAFILGASFVGAEFGAGSLSTQLIYEPRRNRVVVTKAVAVALGLAILAVAILVYIGLLQWAGSSLRGVVHGIDGSWFAARAGDIGRAAGAVALAGVAAYAITIVARRTVAAVAGLLVIGWVSAIIGSLRSWRWVAKFNPASALVVLAADAHRAAEDSARELSVGGAAVCAVVWAVALTIVAAMIFSRREVR